MRSFIDSENLTNNLRYLRNSVREDVSYYYSLIGSHTLVLISTKSDDLE